MNIGVTLALYSYGLGRGVRMSYIGEGLHGCCLEVLTYMGSIYGARHLRKQWFK